MRQTYGPAFREGAWNFERYWNEYQKFLKALELLNPQGRTANHGVILNPAVPSPGRAGR